MSEQELQRQGTPEEEESTIPLAARIWCRYILGMPFPNDGLPDVFPGYGVPFNTPAARTVFVDGQSAHALLEVQRDADWHTIESSYRRLVKRWHPDNPDGDAARFREIQAAYEALEKQQSPAD
jgi:hypothetical protein